MYLPSSLLVRRRSSFPISSTTTATTHTLFLLFDTRCQVTFITLQLRQSFAIRHRHVAPSCGFTSSSFAPATSFYEAPLGIPAQSLRPASSSSDILRRCLHRNGPPLPTPIIPSGTMPIMHLETSSTSSLPGLSQARQRHPDPLRSHTPDPDFVPYFTHNRSTSQLLDEAGTTPATTEASAFDPTAPGHSARRPDSQHYHAVTHDRRAYPRPLNLQLGAQEGLSDGAVAGADDQYGGAPVIPPRSPVREKPSTTAVSRFSFYSDITLPLERTESTAPIIEVPPSEEKEKQSAPRTSKALVCLAFLSILSFSNGLSTTFLATALPTVSQEFEIKAVASFWLVASFLLSRTLALPLCSRMAEAIGPNPIILLGCFLYGLGSVISGASMPISGASSTISAVLFGRCVEGFGSGAISAATPMALRNSNGVSQRGDSVKAVAICYWLAAALGPLLGAGMATTVGWQSFFFLSASLGFAGVVAMPFVLEPPEEDESGSLAGVDFLGWFVLSASLLSVGIALLWAGSVHAWSSPQVLAPLILGLFGAVGWLAHAIRHEGAVLAVPALENTTTLKQCFAAFTLGITYMAMIHFLPLYLLAVKGTSPVAAASTLLSWTMSTFFVSFAMAAFPTIVHHTWTTPLAWMALFISTGLLIALDLHTATSLCVPFGLLAGCAIGALQITLLIAASESDSRRDQAEQTATSTHVELFTFSQSLGHTISIIVGACIFLNVLGNALATTSSSESTIDAIHLLGTARPTDLTFLHACTAALDGVWILCCNLAALAFIISTSSAVSASWRRKQQPISV